MADILERLRNREAKFANAVQGWIEYNLDDERIDEDAVIEIARLRGIEAKLKELIGLLGGGAHARPQRAAGVPEFEGSAI